MRLSLALLLAATATAAVAAPPAPSLAGAKPLDPKWQATTRELYRTAIEPPTVAGRKGANLKLANYIAAKLKAAGWAAKDVHVQPYTSAAGNDTAALVARWPAAGTPTGKPILILAHMDVVEALASDWGTDPFKLVEKDG